MSTRSRKKIAAILLIVSLISLVLFIGVASLSYRSMEGKSNLMKSWKTESLNFSSQYDNSDFYSFKVGFWPDDQIKLPNFKYFKGPATPVKYSTWKYRRKDFFNGQVIIEDWVQGIFSGVYEIEIVEKSKPQLMRLYSDSIEFYLREQYFTIENPTIESEPYYIPEKDEDEQKN